MASGDAKSQYCRPTKVVSREDPQHPSHQEDVQDALFAKRAGSEPEQTYTQEVDHEQATTAQPWARSHRWHS